MHATTFRPRRAFAPVIAALVYACSSGGESSGPAYTIDISVSPSSLTIQQGGSGTVALTLTRGGGFADAVTASVSGLPSGVSVSVSPNQLTGSTTSAVVSVDVGASVTPGTYTATVTASATGVGAATASYTLVVEAVPDYSLSLSPTALTVQAATSGTATVSVARTNFTGAVALSLDAPPSGITGTFAPASPTGTSSTLTVAVDGAVTPGDYVLTIKGSATGPGARTTTLTLTVTAPGDYTLSVDPDPKAIPIGQSGDVTVNIARTNFTGAVTLALVSPPTGVTGVFNPAAPTGNSSTLTLTVDNTAALGAHTLTVMGSASGVATRVQGPTSIGSQSARVARPGPEGTAALRTTGTPLATSVPARMARPGGSDAAVAAATGDRMVSFELDVQPAGSIVLSVAPASVPALQGGVATASVAIARTNFTDVVNLAASGLPSGMTLDFSTASTTTNASDVTVNIGAGVAPGTYPVTITGSGTGLVDATTLLSVEVQAAPTVWNVEYQYSATRNPLIFSYQDGLGPWTQALPIVDNGIYKYRVNLTAGYGGIATADSEPGSGGTGPYVGSADVVADGGSAEVDALLQSMGQANLNVIGDGIALGGYGGSSGTPRLDVRFYLGTVSQLQARGALYSVTKVSVVATIANLSVGDEMKIGVGGRTKLYQEGFDTNPFTVNRVNQLHISPLLFSYYASGATAPSKVGVIFNGGTAVNLDPLGADAWNPSMSNFYLGGTGGGAWGVKSAYATPQGVVGYVAKEDPSVSSFKIAYNLQPSRWQGGYGIVTGYKQTQLSANETITDAVAGTEDTWGADKFASLVPSLSLSYSLHPSLDVLARFNYTPSQGFGANRYTGFVVETPGVELRGGLTGQYLDAAFPGHTSYLIDLPSLAGFGMQSLGTVSGSGSIKAWDDWFNGTSLDGMMMPIVPNSLTYSSRYEATTIPF